MSITTQVLPYHVEGKSFQGYLCLPENQPPLAGVLVAPEWWGLSEHAKNAAEKLAKAGYAALAVDLYGDAVLTDDAEQANTWMNEALAHPETLANRTQAALDAFVALPEIDADKIAAIGYCFGGKVVLDMARRGQAIMAVCAFHANLTPAVKAQAGKVTAKLLIEHGDADTLVSPESVQAFRKEMDEAGVDYHIDVFAGAKHGFTNPKADSNAEKNSINLGYDEHAAETSWQNLLNLLRETIG